MRDLNRAIIVYLGFETCAYPQESTDRLLAEFGEPSSGQLAQQVDALLKELDSIKPDWKRHSLSAATDWAVDQIRIRYPYIDDKAAEALGWAYSWWWH